MWCGLLPRSEIESKRCDVCSIPLDEQKAQQELAVRCVQLKTGSGQKDAVQSRYDALARRR